MASFQQNEHLGVFVPLDNIKVIALLEHVRSGQPVLVVEAYTDKSLEQVRELATIAEEGWEIDTEKKIQAVNVTPENLKSMVNRSAVALADGAENLPGWQERSEVAVLLSLLRHAET